MNKNMRQPDEDGDNSLAEIKNMDVGLGACSSLTTTGRAPSETDITLIPSDEDSDCFDDENVHTPPMKQTRELAHEPRLFQQKALGDHLALSTRPKLVCTRPTCSGRYDQGIIVNSPKDTWNFKPLETLNDLSTSDVLPEFWSTFVHPDGLRYFKFASPQLKATYVTESDVLSQATLHSVSQLISEIEHLITGVEEKGVILPKTVEVYLEVAGIPHAFEEAEVEWRYYMVDITAQRIFWLHEFDATEMSFEIGGVAADSKAVFEHKLASEYWMHMENFPHRTIPANVLKTLMGILMQWSIDQMTSLDSTAPYSTDDLQKLSMMVNKLKELQMAGEANEYLVFSVSRLMGIIMNQRFIHLHGCRGARVTRYQRVRGPGHLLLRSLPFKIISVLAFGESEAMLRRIDKVWIDEIVQMLAWKEHIHMLESDWKWVTCCASAILLLNILLFAITTKVTHTGSLSLPIRALAQVSVFSSAGSVACGLVLRRETKKHERYSASQAALYMMNIAGSRVRSEMSAVIYSIPFALLLWSAIAFLSSITLVFGSASGTNVNTKLIESAASSFLFGMVILLVCSTVFNGRVSHSGGEVDNGN